MPLKQRNQPNHLFQTIQFSIITKASSILVIDWTVSGDTTPDQIVPGSDVNEGYFAFLNATELLRPQHQIV